jgi:hypothetical protein
LGLHINSFKLFLAGHTVAAGNLFRQVVETIALGLISSSNELDVFDRFDKDHYSARHAVRDVRRNHQRLGLNESSLKALEDAQKFYHSYSHTSKLTIGVSESFAGEGLYVGASFDEGKMPYYLKEIQGRVRLAWISTEAGLPKLRVVLPGAFDGGSSHWRS